MKRTIKIFLASSEELRQERIAFGNLVRQLDNIYMKRGIHIHLDVWEELDAAFHFRKRKQDEYDEKGRQSDIFVAMFYTRAGQYTLEELDAAIDENSRRDMPTILIYCRDLQPGDVETAELTEFKQRLEHELGHFSSRYATTDKMHLDFVMWLQRTESAGQDGLKVENDNVTLDGVPIARMSQLPFAADNEDYREMKERIASLTAEVDQLRQAVDQMPTMTALQDLHQQKQNELIVLKEKLESYQSSLLDTARRIAAMQLEKVSGTLQRAMDAFEAGNLAGANALLDEIAREADAHMERLEQDQELVHQDIDAFQLQAKTVLADVNTPIADRIASVTAIYAKADDWANRSAYDKEKYAQLLFDYADFLKDYAHYEEAKQVYLRQIPLSEEIYGPESEDTAAAYNNIGLVYKSQGDYPQALDYYFKALAVFEHVFGTDHPSTATSYNNIGLVYYNQGDYPQALDCFFKALVIYEGVLGTDHPRTATSYNNIGGVYDSQGDYPQALEYYFKALAIDERVLGTDHPDTATDYNNIGLVYSSQGDYPQALEYFFKALAIHECVLGTDHPDTATSYNNIGLVYSSQGDYPQALEYYFKALAVKEHVLGTAHPDTATSYNNIGFVYYSQGDYPQALEYYFKALAICEHVLGTDHPNTASSYNNIGLVYDNQGDYSQALDYYFKALDISEHVLGIDHPSTATSYNNIGLVYSSQGDYPQALEYFKKAFDIFECVLGLDHPNTRTVKENIEAVEAEMG